MISDLLKKSYRHLFSPLQYSAPKHMTKIHYMFSNSSFDPAVAQLYLKVIENIMAQPKLADLQGMPFQSLLIKKAE